MEPAYVLDSRIPVSSRGFTLIEMVVVLAIITIITTIVLVGHSNFDRSLLLTDAAYSVALGAREMQTFGLSSRTFSVGAGYASNIGYGLHVTTLTPNSYILFADTQRVTALQSNCPAGTVSSSPDYKRGNCLYETTSPADGVVESLTFRRGFKISSFCGTDSRTTPAVEYCSGGNSNQLLSLNVVYMRPETDAIMTGRTNGGTYIPFTSVKMYISTADNTSTRGICFSQVGQVTVTQTTCP